MPLRRGEGMTAAHRACLSTILLERDYINQLPRSAAAQPAPRRTDVKALRPLRGRATARALTPARHVGALSNRPTAKKVQLTKA